MCTQVLGVSAEENNTNLNANAIIFQTNIGGDYAPDIVNVPEMEFIGPDAFYIIGNKIILDDTVNHRLLVYIDGNWNKTIELDWNVDVKRLYFNGADTIKIVYLDLNETNYSQYCLAEISLSSGNTLSVNEISGADNILLEYCFDTDGNLITQYLNNKRNSASPALAEEFEIDAEEDAAIIGAVDSIVGIAGTNTYSIHSLYSQSDNNIYMYNYLIKKDGQNNASCLMIEDSINGICQGNFQIAADNDVYQMAMTDNGIYIYKLQEYSMNILRSIQSASQKLLFEQTDLQNQNEAAVLSISSSADTVREKMELYRNINWTFNSTKNANASVTADSSNVTQPSWLQSISDGNNHSVYGIPYCWGGRDSDTFVSDINAGKYAGNVCTDADGKISGTVGMDCSGYVSVVFDLDGKYSTNTLDDCFRPVSNVQYLDILLKQGSHVVIVNSVYTVNGVTYVDTYEETNSTGKITVRTGRNYLTAFINNGYSPMRRNGW